MYEDEIRCPHCNYRKFASHPEHNYHKSDCPEQSKEQLIESVRKSNAVGHCYAERIRNLHTHITQWQGKFHTLRLENNALRKQVTKQKVKPSLNSLPIPPNRVLCYVDGNAAYFTTQELKKQWGDDWNDAPYEHNAGTPYTFDKSDAAAGKDAWEISSIYWAGNFTAPSFGVFNSKWSVDHINQGEIPWLTGTDTKTGNPIMIMAGVTFPEFLSLIMAGGGAVAPNYVAC